MADYDPIKCLSANLFDEGTMKERFPPDVYKRFMECLVTGNATPESDKKVIADCIFTWAREKGAIDFAHWFFPMRGGGGAVGGALSALKMDTLIDLDFKAPFANKPAFATLPADRLFQGETDGSSFPNGGLRVTHAAAAFTTWDRSSPPFVLDKVLRIPCSFVTHYGKCIDDKTPLLRSMDAVKVQGLRLLENMGIFSDAKTIHSYLGWEQEFFVVPAELYKARPDLVNCGRTLLGKLPARHQQSELNYFAPPPEKVNKLMAIVQAEMMKLGCAVAVKHNEVAPGQHEMSPIFCTANVSADSNVLFMEIMNKEAYKLGLMVLFHEKPFKGINGNGKHANWSIGTDTGKNFFNPGKTEDEIKLNITANACLTYGLLQYNELVRCSVAHAGNDHRLGAQEAPPAIISLYPGRMFEEHVETIISGGDWLAYKPVKREQSTGCSAAMAVEANVEDRNRTAPFPFCGNRFEFRAVGSSQNCAFPVMICNAIFAAGMSAMSDLLEGGKSLRDAVAHIFAENRRVIFTGNGYSPEWLAEAEKRGLPNLNTTPLAIAHFNSTKNKELFAKLGIFSDEETEARSEVMYENYVTTLRVEAETMVQMLSSSVVPALAKDLEKYKSFPKLGGSRSALYESIAEETEKLRGLVSLPEKEPVSAEAIFLCDVVMPQMNAVRSLVDKAEGLMEASLYPFPTYAQLVYSHHH